MHIQTMTYETLTDQFIHKPEPREYKVRYVKTSFILSNEFETIKIRSRRVFDNEDLESYHKIPITWDNIEGVFMDFQEFLPFYIQYKKRGRVLKWNSGYEYEQKTIKEWIQPNMIMYLEVVRTPEPDPTLDAVFRECPGELVIGYLAERGLNICATMM